MKLRKILSIATASVMALGMMSMAASAEDVSTTETTTLNNVVLFDGHLATDDSLSFMPFQLGSGIAGSKIKVTFTPAEGTKVGDVALGIAGKKDDENWTWVQDPTNPGFEITDPTTENTVEMTYDEFVTLSGLGNENLRCFVIANWNAKADATTKIELVVPETTYNVTTLFNGPLTNAEFTPAQLGSGIDGSLIRITFTSSAEAEKDWVSIGISATEEVAGEDTEWKSENRGFLSVGPEKEASYTLNYADFVKLSGLDTATDYEAFLIQNWKVKEGTIVNIELLTPAVAE